MKHSNMGKVKILLAQNGIFLAMIVVALIFGAINPRFLSVGNLMTILQQIAELGVISFPIAFVVMMGCADMSVGSVASLAAVLGGTVMVRTSSIGLGILAALAFGLVAGLINGFLVAYMRLNTFVVTLGFLSVWGGLAMFFTNGKTVTQLPTPFLLFGSRKVLGVPVQILILAAMIVGSWYLLNRMAKGKEILAIGGNRRASYLMGISVRRTQMLVLACAGMFAGLTGILLTAKLGAAAPSVGSGLELSALTVVLLGGVAFEGGTGRISGVLAGLLFVGVLQNGLIILGVSAYLKTVFTGAVLVVAVMLDKSIHRIVTSAWKDMTSAKNVPSPSDSHDPATVPDTSQSIVAPTQNALQQTQGRSYPLHTDRPQATEV
ncbi:ABC transporter permease [Bifidobacterium aquikefiricola]|uniref:ABC transporter permease n=1 Tax=Bifidobacterium aquikefiricola TaxID=3059038 RepID=A0AB39U972_9BIFI